MQEVDLRSIAKKNAEYITPPALRQFLASKINKDNITVLEPAIGSGQLLFALSEKISLIDGYDINENALHTAKQNFGNKINIYNDDFIVCNIDKTYDYAIANYPFSLKATDEQKLFIANDRYLSQFFTQSNKKQKENLLGLHPSTDISNIKGRLDFIFILKSFQYATEGLYFCYPGIGYRSEEEKFRKYLIENKFIKEYGIINNCKFEHTAIPILFLHLTKTPNEQTMSFTMDLQTDKQLVEIANFNDNQFHYPQAKKEQECVDEASLEEHIRSLVIKNLISQIQISRLCYNPDHNLPSIEEWKQQIIKAVTEC
jgi:hypothetical protein